MKKTIYLLIVAVIVLLFGIFYYSYGPSRPGVSSKGEVAKSSSVQDGSGEVRAGAGADSVALKPEVRGARFQIRSEGNVNELKIVPSGIPANLTFAYEWMKNGQAAGKGDSVTGFKRGDKFSVSITASDGKLSSESKTFETEIINVPPMVLSVKETAADKTSLTYKVEALDSDGDTLAYSLVDAPAGVTIDQQGVIKWTFNADNLKISFKVKITDGHGGEIIYPLSLDSGKMEPPPPVKK